MSTQLPRTMPAGAIGARPAGSIVVGSGGGWSLGCHCLRMGIGYTYLETEGKGMADHLIEMYDTGRLQWLWRCIKCKLERASAIQLIALTCIPNDHSIDYAAAPDMLAALQEIRACLPAVDLRRATELADEAIAKAKGETP